MSSVAWFALGAAIGLAVVVVLLAGYIAAGTRHMDGDER